MNVAESDRDKPEAREFLRLLQDEATTFKERVSTAAGDWIVRGFIDIFRHVYTISGDTKVVSKLIELMLLPLFQDFAVRNALQLVLARQQNHYPDMSFVLKDNVKFAVDLKSTYRLDRDKANTMTLGAFTGYFRDRKSTSTTTFPYGEYSGHFVLGVVYDRAQLRPDELRVHTVQELESYQPLEFADALSRKTYTCETLENIPAVVRHLEFFAQPKYRISRDRPGSGNTKNIGAVGVLTQLLNGAGPFASLGEEVFDDYWMYYMTKADAKAADLNKPPYTNLEEYAAYKTLAVQGAALAGAIEASHADTEAPLESEGEEP